MAAGLTPSEIRRWDSSAIHQVFQVVKNRDGTFEKFGENLGSVQQQLSDWGGDAGDAFHQEMHHQLSNLYQQGQMAPQLAAAVQQAESDANACRTELKSIDDAAAKHGWMVSDGWIIDYSGNPNDDDGELKPLEDRLAALKVKATNADHELATAMRAAGGDGTLTQGGQPPPQAPPQHGDASPTAPVPHPGDSPYGMHDGKRLTATMEPHVDPHGSASVGLQDNPPGYDQRLGAGAQRDQNWPNYLEGVNADGSHRAYGSMPQALPKPEAVQDTALRTVGAAGRQQGVSYAWGANKYTDSPSQGHNATDAELRQLGATRQTDGSWLNNDGNRIGFDCGGFARFSVAQGTEGAIDLGGGTGNQFSHLTSGAGSAVKGPALPGDLAYFGPSGSEHVAISVGNGVLIEARQSGEAIELLPTQIQGGTPQWMRPNY